MSELSNEQLKEKIVEALKLRFPEPWFENWQVRGNWGGAQMGECFVSGVEKMDGRVTPAIASNLDRLLVLIEAIPFPDLAASRLGEKPTTMPRPSTGHPPAEYRCGICGGCVHFDGTPPNPDCWPNGKTTRERKEAAALSAQQEEQQ